MKKVSIIIPAFDQPSLFPRCLESIPVRDDIEVIIVLNGTNKEIREIAKQYKKDNSEVKIIDKEEALGCWGAMNAGLEEATGEYIYQLDEDDYLNTKEFEKVLDNHLGADLVYVNLEINSGEVWKLGEHNRSGLPDHTSLIKKSFLGEDRYVSEGPASIGGGYLLFQKLLQRKHSYVFTGITAYFYNYPRVGSLYYKATHKEQ